MKNVIEINKLSKIFNNDSGIKNINLKIKKGSFHAIIGPNGAGKTTLIRSILRIYKEYSGEILINGFSSDKKEAFSKIGYLSELPIFPNEFNAKEFLIHSGRTSLISDEKIKALIFELSRRFNMQNLLKRNPNKFSSGQKQKLMLMKILIEDAEIIFMDEPTSNLDPSARIVFFEEIGKINQAGKTIIISSHNLDEIEEKITHVSIMKNGEIIYDKEKGEKRLMDIFKDEVHNLNKGELDVNSK